MNRGTPRVKLFRNGRNQAASHSAGVRTSGNGCGHPEKEGGDRLVIEPAERKSRLLEYLARATPIDEPFPEIEDYPPDPSRCSGCAISSTTNILSDLLRNPQGAVYRRLGEVVEDAVVTSVIVAAELRFGGQRNARPQLVAEIEGLLDRIEALPFEAPADRTYAGRFARTLRRRGRPWTAMISLIAAQALSLACILVTADAAFRHVPDLRVENWLTS